LSIFGDFFFAFVLLEMNEIRRDLKLLSLFESFIRKYNKLSIIFLKNLFRKIKYQIIIFPSFISKPMQAISIEGIY
jgi:hypothetical protein